MKTSGVTTNLTAIELEQVLRAIDAGEAHLVPDSISKFAGSAGCQYDYNGSRYEISEQYEKTISLFRVDPRSPNGTASLLGALEEVKKSTNS